MAKREALRELQARLAKRLQTAQTEGMSVAWLAVKAAGNNYLLPLSQSGEIVAYTAVQVVPYTKAWFHGVINVRGNLVGVVDVGAFLATQGHAAKTMVAVQDASVVTLNAGLEVNVGLRVDALAGLRGNDAFISSSAPTQGAPSYFGQDFVDAQGQHWQALDLRVLAQTPAFLHIAA